MSEYLPQLCHVRASTEKAKITRAKMYFKAMAVFLPKEAK